MAKKVLVIGGSYFIGRVFSILAARETDFELCVLNRGRFPLKNDRIREIKADRHDAQSMQNALGEEEQFDTVIDFCAYGRGDIRSMIKALAGGTKQYIYISSCSVFAPSSGIPKKEDAPLITEKGEYPGAEYAYGKMLLENELKEVCKKSGVAYTIVRPAFVYGPFNYAPRESYYFELMARGQEVPLPTDSHCAFSFVYVKDIARILMGCVGNAAVYDEAYNLAGEEKVTYKSLTKLLGTFADHPLNIKEVTVDEVYRDNIPLPFPLDQDELYDGGKAGETLGFSYTPFAHGLTETYQTFLRSR
ncbi:MAG: NAD-dependent epimerase/dehydratase family protein [Christensenella sp.]|uniref:NAD-dependent epimerase/dehydratase family protein n=1 Tax=Christensenella sp. TaxID=1935934 RepID=UPI002B1ECCFB|nr:NAD-dependent epimerase/dehydratase family protein [Christensenella sp.]MEA5002539.1 NAD-dependent epimerase/dehydratase family protein [Christensenella sp.]